MAGEKQKRSDHGRYSAAYAMLNRLIERGDIEQVDADTYRITAKGRARASMVEQRAAEGRAA